MADEQLFRTTLQGFNKEDVIAYIEELNKTAEENQEWFDKQTKAMAETIKRLNKENKSLKEASANTDNSVELEKIAELEQEIEKKNAQLEKAVNALKQLRDARNSDERVQTLEKEKEVVLGKLRQACERIYEEQQKNVSLTEQLNNKESAGVNSELVALRLKLDSALNDLNKAEEELSALKANPQSDVIDIEKLQSETAKQIEELTAQNRQLTSRLTLMQAQANAAAQSQRAQAGGFTPVETVKDESKYNERIRILEDEVKRLQEENEKLLFKSGVPDDELQILKDKARLYDDIKNNVAKIVDDARKKAAEMIKDAELSSRETLENGISGLSQMQRRLRTMRDEIEQARKVYNESTLRMAGMFSGIEDAIGITDNHLISVLGSQE